MRFQGRAAPLPVFIRSHLKTSERVLASCRYNHGTAVATNERFLLFSDRDSASEPTENRLWVDAISAKWEAPILSLAFSQDRQLESFEVHLVNAGLLAEVVRDRVTSVIVIDRIVDVLEVGKVRFIARKSDSGIEWFTMPLLEIPSNDRTKSAIASALKSLRSTMGI